MTGRIRKIVGTAAAATGLALSPLTDSAAEGPISGSSYNGCATASGTYGWQLTSQAEKLYRTWGSARLSMNLSKCASSVTGAVLQRSETSTADHSYKYWASTVRGQTFTVSLEDTNVRDVRFRICNVHSGGKIDGCGRVQ